MPKIYFTLFLLLLSGCISPIERIDVIEDKFKGQTMICSQEHEGTYADGYGRNYAPRYIVCHFKNADGASGELVHGVVTYDSPVPIAYNEAIDIGKQKLKINSKDDRRNGMTINEFFINLPKGYIYKNDNIEIKVYGKVADVVIKVPVSTISALRAKIKETEENQNKK